MKIPLSVLVVIHAPQGEVLLLERAARPGFWQSVTGSLDRPDEPYAEAAVREVREETGIDAAAGRLERWPVAYTFEIYSQWRHRFAPGVTRNTERLFSLALPARLPVTVAPREHTAFQWLPWREAARKCFSWSNRDAILLLGAALLAAGCATREAPPAAHLAEGEFEVSECTQWYRALDAEIDAAGVRDAQHRRVPGFPHLRVDALHASLGERAAASEPALRTFAERLAELDLESRRFELRNLASMSETMRAQSLRRLADCSATMRKADLATPAARKALLAAIRVEEASASPGSRPQPPRADAVRVRYAPPAAAPVPREVVAGLLARAQFDPLAHPALSEREVDRIAALYAPTFEVGIGGDRDRFGRLRWRRAAGGEPPDLDAAQPTVYVRAGYARYREHVLLQLAYTIWFAGPFDGVVWRVTLAPDGEPLLYEAIDACGGFHDFFTTARVRWREAPPPGAQSLPRVGEGARPVLTLASGSHAVAGVGLVRGTDSLVRYVLRFHDELRSLPRGSAEHASVFGSDGRVPGTRCAQRWPETGFERRFEFEP